MPELPEVETIKESMRKSLADATISSAKVYNRSLRQPVPDNFEKIVCKAKICRIYRIAKYALWELDNGYSIVWHFGMSGKVRITDTMPGVLEKHDHIVITTSKGILIYNDPRRFGLVTAVRTSQLKENPLFKNLGVDPFDDMLTPMYLESKLSGRHTPIKIALLDQSIICGIGNIYASEALFSAKISPLRASNSLTPKEQKTLIESVRLILRKAIAAGGSTLHDYKKPDGDIGYFQLQHAVYGKEGQQCLNGCRNKKCTGIKKIIQGGRSTFYCPHWQK